MKIYSAMIGLSVMLRIGVDSQALRAGFWDGLPAGPFAPGFRLIVDADASRWYPGGSEGSAGARPLRIYLWYPAVKSNHPPMRLNDYVRMAAEDFQPAAGGNRPERGPVALPVPLAKGVEAGKLKTLLDSRTAAIPGAGAAPGKFPLLVMGQGLYYESPVAQFVLCEFLAAHGFVVATCPLTGTQYRLVNLNVEDVETEVRDMEFVLARARSLPMADPGKLGVIGYDLGGMAGLLLAMRNPGVQAFLSLDSGILDTHRSGLPGTHPGYHEERFRIPWMHLTQAGAIRPVKDRSGTPSLFERKAFAASYLVHVPTTNHGAFSSYAMLGPANAVPGYWGPVESDPKPVHEGICRTALAFFDRHLRQDNRALDTLIQAGRASGTSGQTFEIEWKEGESVPPAEAELVNLMITKGMRQAGPVIEQARAACPARTLIDESVLNWLGYHFLYWWGREEEAVAVFELNVSLYPGSWNAHDSLGEACLARGLTDEAIRSYRKSLELNPENSNARAALERLGVSVPPAAGQESKK